MNAGSLRHRVSIQHPVDVADGQGGNDTTWETLTKLWASIEPLDARELFYRQGLSPNVTHSITLRYRSDIDPAHRIALGDRTFHIRGMRNVNERKEALVLLCEEKT